MSLEEHASKQLALILFEKARFDRFFLQLNWINNQLLISLPLSLISVSSLESYRNGDKSLTIDRSTSSASNGSATSGDEDGDDQKTGKSQSRIDKWKAKHEAMLKLAQKTDKSSKSGKDESKDINSATANDAILSLDPSAGVCIDFDDHKDVGSKPHTRHTATLQQQVLSV